VSTSSPPLLRPSPRQRVELDQVLVYLMLEEHASPSRQEVIPPGRLNLDRGKADPDHIYGAQKTIVGIDD
jgi:hypothetical protein